MIELAKYKDACKKRWEDASQVPIPLTKVDESMRTQKEHDVHLMIEKAKEQGKEGAFLLLQKLLDLSWMSKEDQDAFYRCTMQFVEDAKSYDEQLSNENIFQALRNVWIVWMLNMVFEKQIKYHNGIFGYSMLYPYSDNMLDDESIGKYEKKQFNKWFMNRLHGPLQEEYDGVKYHIDDLVHKIEEVFHRDEYPDVYESLYLIQFAQTLSLKQHETISYSEIEDISVTKGGTSVIADGFLINGNMNTEQIQFCMNFGFALQLVDDIQDQSEDKIKGHHTLASTLHLPNKKQAFVEKSFHFLRDLLEKDSNCNPNIKKFVLDNCCSLLLSSVLNQKDEYPSAFIKEIEEAMPVSDVFMKDIKRMFLNIQNEKEYA